MNKLNQIAYKCMAREALYLSKAYERPPERLTNPSAIADEFTLPEEVTGEQVMQQAMSLIRQMATVHPELRDQMDTLFTDDKLLKCGQDYDRLLKAEEAAQEEFHGWLRGLNDEVDNLRDQYREAGGILYESRINPSAFFDRKAIEENMFGFDIDNQTKAMVANSFSAFNQETLKEQVKEAGMNDVHFFPATADHPSQIVMPKGDLHAVLDMALKQVRDYFNDEKVMPSKQMASRQRKYAEEALSKNTLQSVGATFDVPGARQLVKGYVPQIRHRMGTIEGLDECREILEKEMKSRRRQALRQESSAGPSGP